MKKFQKSAGIALCLITLAVSFLNLAVDLIAGDHMATVLLSSRFGLIFCFSVLLLFSSNTNYKIGRVIQILVCYFSGLFTLLHNPFESAAIICFLISLICIFIYGYAGGRGVGRTIRGLLYFGIISTVTSYSIFLNCPDRYIYPLSYFILLFVFALILKYGYTYFHEQKKVYKDFMQKSVNIATELREKYNDREVENVAETN